MAVKKEDWIPYTYFLVHVQTGQKYYGVRYAKGCNPSEFWVSYYTSSKYVKKLILETGADSFIFEIRKTFNTPLAARAWEHKVLRRMNAVKRSDFLNKTDNISISPLLGQNNPATNPAVRKKISDAIKERAKTYPNGMLGKTTPDNVRKKQSIAKLGQLNPFYGKSHSATTKETLSEMRVGDKNPFYGRSHSAKTRSLMSDSRTGIAKPKIECPHCSQAGAAHVMHRWHFDNCKRKIS